MEDWKIFLFFFSYQTRWKNDQVLPLFKRHEKSITNKGNVTSSHNSYPKLKNGESETTTQSEGAIREKKRLKEDKIYFFCDPFPKTSGTNNNNNSTPPTLFFLLFYDYFLLQPPYLNFFSPSPLVSHRAIHRKNPLQTSFNKIDKKIKTKTKSDNFLSDN